MRFYRFLRFGKMRSSLIFCSLFLATGCYAQLPAGDTALMGLGIHTKAGPAQNAMPLHPKGRTLGKEPVSDGSYERFLDSLISRKGAEFSKKTIEAGEEFDYDRMTGPREHIPATLVIDGTKFLMGDMQVVNDGEGLRNVRVEVDTAFLFTYRGRKFGYVNASDYNCNGSGCVESYHIIADFKTRRLYLFDMFAEPSISTPYFGDVNHDGQLDFVVPEYVTGAGSQIPYSDTTEKIELTPYTLTKRGRFVPIIRYDKRPYFLIGRFDGGNFAPRNFKIIAQRWFN